MRDITRNISIANSEAKNVTAYEASYGDVRLSVQKYELFMFVSDRQQSLSAINTGIGDFTRDTRLVAFWSEDPSYVEYLRTSFENAWSQLAPTTGRVSEMSKQDT